MQLNQEALANLRQRVSAHIVCACPKCQKAREVYASMEDILFRLNDALKESKGARLPTIERDVKKILNQLSRTQNMELPS
jgi:hypothetical protein